MACCDFLVQNFEKILCALQEIKRYNAVQCRKMLTPPKICFPEILKILVEEIEFGLIDRILGEEQICRGQGHTLIYRLVWC